MSQLCNTKKPKHKVLARLLLVFPGLQLRLTHLFYLSKFRYFQGRGGAAAYKNLNLISSSHIHRESLKFTLNPMSQKVPSDKY